MKLTSTLNSFLNLFYNYSDLPANSEQGITAKQFYESVIARAVQSPEFRQRLLHEPEAVMAEIGIQLPEGIKVTFVENTAQVVHIVIPPYIGE